MLFRWADMFGVEDSSWYAYRNSRDPSVCHELTTLERIKQEIDLRRSLGSLKSNWGWLYTSFLCHVASVKPYMGICECAFSKKSCLLESSSSFFSLGSSSTSSGKQSGMQ